MDAAYKSRPCTVARRVYGHFNGLGITFASDLTAEERRIAEGAAMFICSRMHLCDLIRPVDDNPGPFQHRSEPALTMYSLPSRVALDALIAALENSKSYLSDFIDQVRSTKISVPPPRSPRTETNTSAHVQLEDFLSPHTLSKQFPTPSR